MKNILLILTMILFSCQTATITEVAVNKVPTKYVLTVGTETHKVVTYHQEGDYVIFACKGEKAYPLKLHKSAITIFTDSNNKTINF